MSWFNYQQNWYIRSCLSKSIHENNPVILCVFSRLRFVCSTIKFECDKVCWYISFYCIVFDSNYDSLLGKVAWSVSSINMLWGVAAF